MKNVLSIFLCATFLTSTVACSKTNNQTDNTTGGKVAVSDTKSSQSKNPKAIVPAGTSFNTILQEDISTAKNQNNDRFTLQVKNSLLGGNKILQNAKIQGHLEDIVKAGRSKKASLHLVFDDILLQDGSTYPVNATLVNTQVETKTKGKFIQNTAVVLGGAVAGHFLGNQAKFKHGGLAGGTAAAAYVLSSPGGEVVLNKKTDIKLKLDSPVDTSP